jgi:hypothetical protein
MATHVPTYFTNAQRRAVLQATPIDGMNVNRLLKDERSEALPFYHTSYQTYPSTPITPRSTWLTKCTHTVKKRLRAHELCTKTSGLDILGRGKVRMRIQVRIQMRPNTSHFREFRVMFSFEPSLEICKSNDLATFTGTAT